MCMCMCVWGGRDTDELCSGGRSIGRRRRGGKPDPHAPSAFAPRARKHLYSHELLHHRGLLRGCGLESSG